MATAELKVVTLTISDLQAMINKAADKGADKAVTKYREEHQVVEDPVPMTALIGKGRGKYGSRNTVANYRDQIIAENPNQDIAIKRGRCWWFYPRRFEAWFMKQKKLHEEELKLDPRLRGD